MFSGTVKIIFYNMACKLHISISPHFSSVEYYIVISLMVKILLSLFVVPYSIQLLHGTILGTLKGKGFGS